MWSGLLESYAIWIKELLVNLETRGGRGRTALFLKNRNVVLIFKKTCSRTALTNAIYGWMKELGNMSPICVKIGRVSVVEQIISSNKRITTIQVERESA